MTLRPRGPLPPQVYWRRRTVVVVPLLLVVGLAGYAACSPSGAPRPTAAQVLPVASARAATSGAAPASTAPRSSEVPSSSASPSSSSASPSPTGSGAVPACAPAALSIAAVASAPSYPVGSEPVLSLQVTDTGAAPCTQDLSDSQVELRVYNGAARVWGSHDCQVAPGSTPTTLAPGRPVRLAVTWSGLASQPGCGGQRLRAPAGFYTLYALLAGVQGTPAPFSLT